MNKFLKKILTKKTLPAAVEKEIFMPFGFPFQWSDNNKKIYSEAAILEAVINKRAQCFGNAVVYVTDKTGNEPESVQAKRIRNLFAEPNKLMSWVQFYRLVETYRLLYGYCIVLKMSINNDKVLPTSLFIIDPAQITIKYNQNTPYFGQSQDTDIYIAGQKTSLKLDDLIIFNDLKLGFGDNPFLAQSRMTCLCNENKLVALISNAAHAIIRNRGAIGILSKDVKDDTTTAAVFQDDVSNLHEAYRKYGITSEQWNIIITTAALKYQSMIPPLRDLMLSEFEEQSAKKICAVFDLPFELFPFAKEGQMGNENKKKQSELDLYQNYIIPCSKGDAELFTKSLCKGTDLTISFDYSDMPVFQENMQQKAQAINTAIAALNSAADKGYITVAEWRELASEYININPAAIIPNKLPITV
ncbi:MAG: phage portal protein [Prevotellaceae bacterium]|jgi:hypothetical protein|nr:phage portal protein [Prevotellaceae bacterium]